MKRLPMIAAAIGLILVAPAALAQPNNAPAQKTEQKSANKAARQSAKAPARRATARKTARATQQRAAPRVAVNRRVTTQKKAAANAVVNRTRNVNTNVQRNVTTRKVDVTRYRKAVQAPRRYRAARAWAPPSGYAYQRYNLGQRIPASLLVAGFFLTGVSAYGLDSAPYGYVWVRDGTDAVLVNRYTGEVIQVQYGLFY